MNTLYYTTVQTKFGPKEISVVTQNILDFEEEIDILTTSAFYRSYAPTPKTIFAALYSNGISVKRLAMDPVIDLRELCNVWLSATTNSSKIKRIGCIEMSHGFHVATNPQDKETEIINSLRAYFQILDIASTAGIKMSTIVLPMLGAGRQHISANLMLMPMLNECVEFLKRNASVNRIYFVDLNQSAMFQLAQTMANSYSLFQESRFMEHGLPLPDKSKSMVFISHSSSDRNIADNLCSKLEGNGIKVWYAPRNVQNDYATSITNAIAKSTHFVIILSKNSMSSEHVLNEIDLAFKELPHNIKFKPLRIDDTRLAPSFNYYLSRQHWMDAIIPPIEQRLEEFVQSILNDL